MRDRGQVHGTHRAGVGVVGVLVRLDVDAGYPKVGRASVKIDEEGLGGSSDGDGSSPECLVVLVGQRLGLALVLELPRCLRGPARDRVPRVGVVDVRASRDLAVDEEECQLMIGEGERQRETY